MRQRETGKRLPPSPPRQKGSLPRWNGTLFFSCGSFIAAALLVLLPASWTDGVCQRAYSL